MPRTLRSRRWGARSTKGRRHARVLVVEDNPVNQKVALMLLGKLGIHAEIAQNGLEGVEKSASLPYDAIFMDCQMPEMNGYEATVQIRRTAGPNQRTPIIAMTAQAINGSREFCLDQGMDDFVSKPIQPDDLVRVLDAWLPQIREDALVLR
jgi:two-component system sensor histidine kinase/response regulator